MGSSGLPPPLSAAFAAAVSASQKSVIIKLPPLKSPAGLHRGQPVSASSNEQLISRGYFAKRSFQVGVSKPELNVEKQITRSIRT